MAKTASFAIMHFVIAFLVAWLLTGSVWIGGTVALVEPAVNTVAFFFHDRFWRRFEAEQRVGEHQASTEQHALAA
ncbi:MAG: DUF2061 domain-containing protein [Haliea sp.]|jgi:uncharacterized membrane protein